MEPDAATPLPDVGPAKERSRDRAATGARILEAAQTILSQEGSAGFGVNAVARAAGVDKQLIYRYFGGLDGLLEALGDSIAQWWAARLQEGTETVPAASYAALMEQLALRLLHVMRTEPLAMQSVLWEVTDASGPVRSMSAARSRAFGLWMARARGTLSPPEGVDAAAINAVIVSSVIYMVLASRTSDVVIGLPTDDPKTWERIENAVRCLVRGAYSV